MEDKNHLLENFLKCMVCSEMFTDPVSLSCNHNFCSKCLRKSWEQTKDQNCPKCNRRSSKSFRDVNFALKELTDLFAGRQKEKGEKKPQEVCSKHPGEHKLFCMDEKKPVCPVCEFSRHQGHKVVPIEQAINDMKSQLRYDLKFLMEKRDKCKEVEKMYGEMIEHCKKQLSSTERQIRAEFDKLRQILKEEEESRLAALRAEEEKKGEIIRQEMKRMQDQIHFLSGSISAVEEDLRRQSISFFNSYKLNQTTARAHCSLSDPQPVSGALLDVAKHLGNLPLAVLRRMAEKIRFNPVVLDPNTAHARLQLSDDLTTVKYGDIHLWLPDNPERSTQCLEVLGSQGFSSGKHSWEVEVGDHPYWYVGFAKESLNRKEKHNPTPRFGIWCLMHSSGKYAGTPEKILTVKKSLKSIRVQLDYDKGKVYFHNPEDMTLIFTHKDTFTETLFPYLSIGKNDDEKSLVSKSVKVRHHWDVQG